MNEMGPIELLKTLGDGKLLADFYEHYVNMVRMIAVTHKKGTITLKIELKPSSDPETREMDTSAWVTSPSLYIKRRKALHVTDTHHLSARNPRQPELPPNTIEMPAMEERRDIDGKSRAAGEQL